MTDERLALFRFEVERRLGQMSAALDADDTLPGVLFLDEGTRLVARPFRVASLDERGKERLALRALPALVRARRPRRIAWIMPAWRGDRTDDTECLVMLLIEPGRVAVAIAAIARDGVRPPKLGNWQRLETKEVTGLFVDALYQAVEDVGKKRVRVLRSRR
jgi:hypothetical protein